MHNMLKNPLYQALKKISLEPQAGIRPLDLHIGELLASRASQNQDEVLLGATLASAAVGQGHSCLPLAQAGHIAATLAAEYLSTVESAAGALLKSGIAARTGGLAPLILDQQQNLYLYRYHQYETRIASNLKSRADTRLDINIEAASKLLAQLAQHGNLDKAQKTAAALALIRPLLIISGGPGTGKTYTLAYTLALIQGLADQPLRIALAAPTGKAAARMNASISAAKAGMPANLSAGIPEEAQTLHRLLGLRPGADDFNYHQSNPLHIDLLVVDEASMLDLVLMDGLCRALPEDCRLILMGDHHQLPSVDAGNIFSELCGTGEIHHQAESIEILQQLTGRALPPAPLAKYVLEDTFALLSTNHRQSGAKTLAQLAAAVDRGELASIEEIAQQNDPAVNIQYLNADARMQWLAGEISRHFRAMLTADSLEQAFSIMEDFRFLCAVREGPMGVEGINRFAEQVLRQQGLIQADMEYYPGKPIIIRHNHYRLQLFNGDTGLLWKDENGTLKAWFNHQDGDYRAISIARLPGYDTAYAITVHQAQGSEFKQVLLLLPEEQSRVLSRELIYTGVTRCSQSLSLCCDQEMLKTAIDHHTRRYSGLNGLLEG